MNILVFFNSKYIFNFLLFDGKIPEKITKPWHKYLIPPRKEMLLYRIGLYLRKSNLGYQLVFFPLGTLYSAGGRSENFGHVLLGGHNLPFWLRYGLTDWPKSLSSSLSPPFNRPWCTVCCLCHLFINYRCILCRYRKMVA